MSKNSNLKLLVAGGGTGGHILAGVAIADAWCAKQGKGSQVLFVGAKGGLEEKLVPKAGYFLVGLRIGTLNRVGLKRKLKTLYQLPWAFLYAFVILLKFRPDRVIGVGGYSSGPVVLSAKLLAILRIIPAKIGVLEQNSVFGLTNRILAQVADILFLVFPGMEDRFPGKKVVVTGNPIRSSMQPMAPAPRDPFTVFIFGGSQGAMGINTLVMDALPHWTPLRARLRFVHQTGEKDYERVKQAYQASGMNARVERFIYDMPEVYQQAALVICRSGSSTLAEVAAVGRAAILIPLPTASDQHQEKNALVYSEVGAAVLLNQLKSNGMELASSVQKLMEEPQRISQMEQKVRRFFRPTAAADVVEGLVHHV
jgi:UDP-N-acetylglucosamine--N-acetylmuramyl-(pentapeptide) pyrophosphoryl-undecaprenol N-acetylglucosamine transferase